jgi:hypothetical protein
VVLVVVPELLIARRLEQPVQQTKELLEEAVLTNHLQTMVEVEVEVERQHLEPTEAQLLALELEETVETVWLHQSQEVLFLEPAVAVVVALVQGKLL